MGKASFGFAGVVALAALSGACLSPQSFTLLGHACESDTECGSKDLICDTGLHCAPNTVNEVPDAYVPPQPAFPIRIARYSSAYPYLFDAYRPYELPSDAHYSHADSGTFFRQMDDLSYGNIPVALYNYDGSGTDSFEALLQDLQRLEGHDGLLAVAFEYEYEPVPRLDQKGVGQAFRVIRETFAGYPNLLKVDGGWVVFVHSSASEDPCEVASRYVRANQQYQTGAYIIIRQLPGPKPNCPDQPQGWYLENNTIPEAVTESVFAVSPGARFKDGGVQMPRDAGRFAASLSKPVPATTKFQLVFSYNEWPSGDAVESSPAWASDSGRGLYLDALHAHPASY